MTVEFEIIGENAAQTLSVDLSELVIAGWAGRDQAAIEHHIEELAAIGVPRPSATPLFYRVAADQLTQADRVQMVGAQTSGEVEAFVFSANGVAYVSIASDHTDRELEAHSVALSKQVCAKPVARQAWRLDEVVGHWDDLVIRSWIEEDGKTVSYQEGPLASLRTPADLIAGYANGASQLPDGVGMTCGTVPVIGGIRPASAFTMELYDPKRDRALRHTYAIDVLPVVA